jgi:hypothetical protein
MDWCDPAHCYSLKSIYIPSTALTILALISSCRSGLRETNNGRLEMWLSRYFRTFSSLAQIFNDMLPLKFSARKGEPRHADEHEQPRNSTLQPGQVQRGRRDKPTDARTSREGAMEGAPTHANEKAESSA